jgi:phosphogluconate dehydratase
MTHRTVEAVTRAIADRSRDRRAAYEAAIVPPAPGPAPRSCLSCANVAHAVAAAPEDEKGTIAAGRAPNIGIVTAYNDMLSAHEPMGEYPAMIKAAARRVGATAQVAGGVPAMCDGVTQGRAGMDLSLFSRDVIAMATAVGLSHDVFDAAICLGTCDKIVPGLLIGALRFGHLPMIFVPAGPMPSGLPNKEKQRIRQLAAEGKASRAELLEAESASYHSPGTCTFYGTANSNQMMMEVMGLHVPGAAFVNPGTGLRTAMNRAAMHRLAKIALNQPDERPLGLCVDERAIVNAVVGLLATGGSTNHAIHLPAIARAAGISIDWQDFDDLSAAVPLIAHVYPGGAADVNQFHAAGGMAFTIRTLLDAGLLHGDIPTVAGNSLADYARDPAMDGEQLVWRDVPESRDESILRAATNPFRADGGMRLVKGNLGRAIFKTSAVDEERWTIEAPARVFEDQESVQAAFKAGELDLDVVVVVRGQGPQANGMPELHKLTPALGVLQDRGHKVALVTDGRMSGASGKVPAAIHLCPEAMSAGPIARVRDGDVIRLCARQGQLDVLVDAAEFLSRPAATIGDSGPGTARELFAFFRTGSDDAEAGASAMLKAAGL